MAVTTFFSTERNSNEMCPHPLSVSVSNVAKFKIQNGRHHFFLSTDMNSNKIATNEQETFASTLCKFDKGKKIGILKT